MKNKIHVKTGDNVIVLSGKYRGQKGKVLEVSPSEGKVIVEGINVASKHVKPTRMGEQGGIVKAEAAFYACKVSPYCSKCKRGARVGHKIENDKKIRVCTRCGQEL